MCLQEKKRDRWHSSLDTYLPQVKVFKISHKYEANKNREFITRTSIPQEKVKEILQAEEYDVRQKVGSTQRNEDLQKRLN